MKLCNTHAISRLRSSSEAVHLVVCTGPLEVLPGHMKNVTANHKNACDVVSVCLMLLSVCLMDFADHNVFV